MQQQPPVQTMLLIYIVVVGILIWRYSRPMKMSITRLWVAPLLFLAITIVTIAGTQQLFPAPEWTIALAILIGAVLGTPIGLYSAMHRTVRPTEKRGVMLVDPSWKTLVIWLAAFIIKTFVRVLVPHGEMATIAGDGVLVFGISAVLGSYYAIYTKYRAAQSAHSTA